MRKLLLGLFTVATLGFGASSIQPAEAQPYYGYRPHYRPVVTYPARPAYRPYYRPHRPYYRPYGAYRPVYAGPRCFVRPQRVWTAYGWVRRPVRVCRY
jgi:hypothetical protein